LVRLCLSSVGVQLKLYRRDDYDYEELRRLIFFVECLRDFGESSRNFGAILGFLEGSKECLFRGRASDFCWSAE
jgi:hypothetical protein